MKIAIDVMGGDNFPSANIDGVFEYLEDINNSPIHFFLVGNQLLIEKYLKNKKYISTHISISINIYVCIYIYYIYAFGG